MGAKNDSHRAKMRDFKGKCSKTNRGPHNGRKTFQAIRAGVLGRFPGVSPRFLQVFLHFSFKNRHLGHFSKIANMPKMGVWATLETEGSRN